MQNSGQSLVDEGISISDILRVFYPEAVSIFTKYESLNDYIT